MVYSQHYSTRETPQDQPIPGSKQVANDGGGYSFAVDDWKRLDRFLILGAEGGTYYTGERKLTIDNAQAVARCLQADGQRTVKRIVEVSDKGLAAKNDPALFALAMAAAAGDKTTRIEALIEALPRVARIGTHLFTFLEYVQAFRGWGRTLRLAVRNWYLGPGRNDLAFQLIKYRQRNGWTHRDALRLAHPYTDSEIIKWAVKGDVPEVVPDILQGYLIISEDGITARQAARAIKEYRLPREAVPTELLNHPEVWDALLEHMPMTAMIRNLATMTRVGLLKPMSAHVKTIVDRLHNEAVLAKARIHPIAVLAAQLTYGQGHGMRGHGEWTPVPQIVDALDDAFYLAFKNIEPTGKRWMLGLDVSGSMTGSVITGVPGLTPRVGAAAMAMVTARSEAEYMMMAFSSGFVPFPASAKMRLNDVCGMMNGMPFDSTDCSRPMRYALDNRIPVDVFAIYTDSETNTGRMHPVQALRQYREKMGIDARLIVVAMTSNGFSIADPDDGGMLDVVGFSADTPQVMAQFARGEL